MRYSTALSGLLKAARRALVHSSLAKPISIILAIVLSSCDPPRKELSVEICCCCSGAGAGAEASVCAGTCSLVVEGADPAGAGVGVGADAEVCAGAEGSIGCTVDETVFVDWTLAGVAGDGLG